MVHGIYHVCPDVDLWALLMTQQLWITDTVGDCVAITSMFETNSVLCLAKLYFV